MKKILYYSISIIGIILFLFFLAVDIVGIKMQYGTPAYKTSLARYSHICILLISINLLGFIAAIYLLMRTIRGKNVLKILLYFLVYALTSSIVLMVLSLILILYDDFCPYYPGFGPYSYYFDAIIDAVALKPLWLPNFCSNPGVLFIDYGVY